MSRNSVGRLICIILLSIINSSMGQNFILATYQDNAFGTSIKIEKIDLESKAEIASLLIPITGELITKLAIKVNLPNQTLYLVVTTDGEPGKNCVAGRPITRYAVIDTSLSLVGMDSIQNIGLYQYINTSRDSIEFAYSELINDSTVTTGKASFILSRAHRIARTRSLPDDYMPFRISQIGRFNDLTVLDDRTRPICWDTGDNFELYMLKLGPLRRTIIDSLKVGNFLAYAQVFAIPPLDSLLYTFSLSYDIPHNEQRVAQRNNAPGFLKKYSLANFSVIDSIPIPNISADSDYVRNELGRCEVVGPYILYYFFKSDDYRYFSPAMLFIFDTRTNETTWLRVGWR